MQPSLQLKTATGLFHKSGLKTRSQLTKKLLQSTNAKTFALRVMCCIIKQFFRAKGKTMAQQVKANQDQADQNTNPPTTQSNEPSDTPTSREDAIVYRFTQLMMAIGGIPPE
jgi:hypothetical protein